MNAIKTIYIISFPGSKIYKKDRDTVSLPFHKVSISYFSGFISLRGERVQRLFGFRVRFIYMRLAAQYPRIPASTPIAAPPIMSVA